MFTKAKSFSLICQRCGQRFHWIKKSGCNELGRGFGGGGKPPKYCSTCKFSKNSFKIIETVLKEEQKCAKCGKDKSLIVHHIDFDKYNNMRDNLIVLCRPCHGRLFSFYSSKIPRRQKITLFEEWIRQS